MCINSFWSVNSFSAESDGGMEVDNPHQGGDAADHDEDEEEESD